MGICRILMHIKHGTEHVQKYLTYMLYTTAFSIRWLIGFERGKSERLSEDHYSSNPYG